ncbi:hypothetical protein Vretimale_2556 [Volvox reticuliferus]|uniref:Uncharacterized protein n=1 Tax=Volvox reticuliferus TaxID=1737510 RepID=A0A8J4FG52_9CHLO|nr:hypothetical protein Vretifemale_4808 [Volvox reticuliferus]GIL96763.1 hypothetical protein Vretimale_2556 [Volvox reticuliferus]
MFRARNRGSQTSGSSALNKCPRPLCSMRLDNGPSHQFGPSVQDQLLELQTKVGALRRDNALLLTQLARAVKCLNAVSAENQLLRTEIASLLPSLSNQDIQR